MIIILLLTDDELLNMATYEAQQSLGAHWRLMDKGIYAEYWAR